MWSTSKKRTRPMAGKCRAISRTTSWWPAPSLWLTGTKPPKLAWSNSAFTFPPLVDNIQDTTERAYTGWPDRLYVIDQSGRVAYKSKAGPFGFHPEEMAKVLQSLAPAPKK